MGGRVSGVAEQGAEARAAEEIRLLRQRLGACEERYRTLVETNLYGIQVIDPGGRILFVNTVQRHILRRSARDLESVSVYDLITGEEQRRSLSDFLDKVRRDAAPSAYWSGEFARGDGSRAALRLNWSYLGDARNRGGGFISFTTEVAEDEAAHCAVAGAAMAVAENGPRAPVSERMRRIAEMAAEVVIGFSADGRITYMNERGMDHIGYVAEELETMEIADILPPDQLAALRGRVMDRPAGLRHMPVSADVQIINRSFELISMEGAATFLPEDGDAGEILLMAKENSLEKARRSILEKNARHDVALTFARGIRGNLYPRLESLLAKADAPDAAAVRRIMADLDLIAGYGALHLEAAQLGPLIRDTARKLAAGTGVRPILAIAANLRPLAFDAALMAEALGRVIVNALDVSPSGGAIRISAENTTLKDPESVDPPLPKGDYIRVAVHDNGPGIDAAEQDAIFDPFHTGRPAGGPSSGPGLGLSVAEAIIRRHGGWIGVKSRPGGRTIFQIFLPASDLK